MMLRKLITTLPLAAALLVLPAEAENGNKRRTEKEKHSQGKSNHKVSERDNWGDRDAVQYRSRTERERFYNYNNQYGWPRATQGHVPNDLNGDGIITRREWPGNTVSFRRLDRNGDGVITSADRQNYGRRH
jgi:hypothetical protein